MWQLLVKLYDITCQFKSLMFVLQLSNTNVLFRNGVSFEDIL